MTQSFLKILVYNTNHCKDFIVDYLKALRHIVHEVDSKESFIERLLCENYNLTIIDLYPGHDPFFFLDYLKENYIGIITVMITDSNKEADKILAYKKGVDIYASLPVNVQEIMYRIAVINRYMHPNMGNSSALDKRIYELGNFTIDSASLEVFDGNGCAIFMDTRLLLLLKFMVQYPDAYIPKNAIALNLYGGISNSAYRRIDSDIKLLRRAISDCTIKIKTINRIGYKFERVSGE